MQDQTPADEGREGQLRSELQEEVAHDQELDAELRRGERREGELEEELREVERHAHKVVETIVSFPLAGKVPERLESQRDEQARTVLRKAMAYFEVSDDATATYKLARHGEPVNLDATIGELAGDEHSLKLTLVKELTQGWRRADCGNPV